MRLSHVHAAAGTVGLLTIILFWSSTAVVELFGDATAIAGVKRAILWGMIVLIPAMAAVGGTGFRLSRNRQGRLVDAKRRRMPLIALNGVLVLVPSAFYLDHLAADGQFGTAFYGVQAVELIAGATNITLMGLNMRDGLKLARQAKRPSAGLNET
jgi:hypothetical protein